MSSAEQTGAGAVGASTATIVIGHDGSSSADAALTAWLSLAKQLGAPVTVVRTWSIDTASRPPGWEFGYVSSYAEMGAAVRGQLEKDVATLTKQYPAMSINLLALRNSPSKGLIDFARDAQMLVVGSRGLGGFSGMLLGSVSDQCVRYATCPVLVVRRRPAESNNAVDDAARRPETAIPSIPRAGA